MALKNDKILLWNLQFGKGSVGITQDSSTQFSQGKIQKLRAEFTFGSALGVWHQLINLSLQITYWVGPWVFWSLLRLRSSNGGYWVSDEISRALLAITPTPTISRHPGFPRNMVAEFLASAFRGNSKPRSYTTFMALHLKSYCHFHCILFIETVTQNEKQIP